MAHAIPRGEEVQECCRKPFWQEQISYERRGPEGRKEMESDSPRAQKAEDVPVEHLPVVHMLREHFRECKVELPGETQVRVADVCFDRLESRRSFVEFSSRDIQYGVVELP